MSSLLSSNLCIARFFDLQAQSSPTGSYVFSDGARQSNFLWNTDTSNRLWKAGLSLLNQYFNSLTYEVIEMLKGMHFYPVLSRCSIPICQNYTLPMIYPVRMLQFIIQCFD